MSDKAKPDLSAARLRELNCIARAATRGPWQTTPQGWSVYDCLTPGLQHIATVAHNKRSRTPKNAANAAHIAAFSPDVALALIAEVERLRLLLGERDEKKQ